VRKVRDVFGPREILVGTEGLPEDERALAYLCTLIAADHVRLRIVHVLPAPMTAPVNAPMPDAEARASALLDRAREMVTAYGIPVETVVLRGRSVGEALVEEARRAGSGALFVRFRNRPGPLGTSW